MTDLEKLKLMTAWESDPPLSEPELEQLLADAALLDANGLTPLNEEWTPTYDLNAAASTGWLIKAARASTLIEVDPPGSGIVTSKVFDNCRAMARVFGGKKAIALSIRRIYT